MNQYPYSVGPTNADCSQPIKIPAAKTKVLAAWQTRSDVIVLNGDMEYFLLTTPPMNVPIHNEVMVQPANEKYKKSKYGIQINQKQYKI